MARSTQDLMNSLLAPAPTDLPPVPMRDDYDAADYAPAVDEDESPAEVAAAQAQYKLAPPGDAGLKKIGEERGPAQIDPVQAEKDAESSENQDIINKLDKQGDARLDDEISDADAMQSPFEGPASDSELSADPKQKLSSTLSTYQQLKNAQEKAQGQNENLGLLSAFNKLAQASATNFGGKIDDNSDFVKQLQANNNKPAEDLLTRYKLGGDESNDPNSDISKFARTQAIQAMATRAGKVDEAERAKYEHVFDNMSAAQLEKLGFKNILGNKVGAGRQGFTNIRGLLVNGHPLDQEPSTGQYYDGITHLPVDPSKDMITSAVARKDMLDDTYKMTPTNGPLMGSTTKPVAPTGKTTEKAIDPESGDEIEQKEFTLDDLNKAQIKNYDKIVVPTMKAVKKDKSVEFARKINNAATIMLKKLENVDPNNPRIDSGVAEALAAQYATMATGAAPAEGTIAHLRGAGGMMNNLERITLAASKGEMTPADLQFYKDAALKFSKGAATDARDASQTYIDNIKSAYPSLPLTDDNVAKMLGITSLTKNSTVDHVRAADAAKTKPKAGMVRFQDSQGGIHDIPQQNLDAAKKRDPGLKVME